MADKPTSENYPYGVGVFGAQGKGAAALYPILKGFWSAKPSERVPYKRPVIGPDGKPVIGKDGNPVMEEVRNAPINQIGRAHV